VEATPLSGVLFDWRGTLVCDPEEELWLEAAAARLDRELDPSSLAMLLNELEIAARRPDLAQRLIVADCSAADHRAVNLDLFRTAGMDEDLAVQLYELDSIPTSTPSTLTSPTCSLHFASAESRSRL
jgi:hypothetical protein